MASHFSDRLCAAVDSKKTPLVIGLDPVYSRLPAAIRGHRQMNDEFDAAAAVDAIFDFCTQVMRVVAPMVPAVKINIAFFEKYLWEGLESYYALISEADDLGLEIIGDVKRGDVGHTAEMYAAAHLQNSELTGMEDVLSPDAITVNGYVGSDGIEPFAKMAAEEGKGLFVLVRTSNPSASEFQDLQLEGGQTAYEKMAEIVGQIAGRPEHVGEKGYSDVGMVVGGTAPETSASLRTKYDKIWFLVPGYGSQGAEAVDCIRFCRSDGMGALINASRSIIYAYEKPKYRDEFGDDWKKCIEQAVIDAKIDLANAMQSKL
ncbi:MAG: orotidine-5'-phosphate decarboxylase [Sedimentisphaerales bacterium]|nr:orotidine-5'-phosphate decarboxylase [Sedimentisphaerales bacterium]